MEINVTAKLCQSPRWIWNASRICLTGVHGLEGKDDIRQGSCHRALNEGGGESAGENLCRAVT